ncbi:uncharacterized protein APUU_60825S [Aspergillus puulaauensis]|uniref:Uncharacterized protein n=1 Tax=Aspergillus puulaauensis TaxID=1220207 RepID=A0A7R8AR70_9EURO|nr:uncharacterized protein APUU_60825S [Aspergillus puulaauensis]BCS27777.1 hypothetical protein APUU_60825S [Aspergillus puulaauensis]
MKGFVGTSLLALAAFSASASAASNCESEKIMAFVWRYHVKSTDSVPDIPGICGGLWDNLKRFGECGTASNTWCGDAGDGKLGWDFNVANNCNPGMIESTWYEATRNEYGPVDCVEPE